MRAVRRWNALLVCSVLASCAASPELAEPQDSNEEDSTDLLRRRSDVIALASGAVDTTDQGEDARAMQGERVLLKFSGPPTAEQLDDLEASVERVYTYLPDDAFLVKLPADGRFDANALGVSWVGRYRPEHKFAPGLRMAAASSAERVIVMLQIFPDAELGRTIDALRSAGVPAAAIVGQEELPRFHRVRLLLSADELARLQSAIAALPELFWMDVEGRRTLLNDTTVWVGQSGLDGNQATPVFAHGIHGEGQIVGILDSGIDADMCYFRDPTRGLPPMNVCNFGTQVDLNQRKIIAVDFLWDKECAGGISTADEWDGHGHGTHVAGTIAGDDLKTPIGHDAGDGMAPGAKLVIQDCGGPETDHCADCSGIGCPVVDLNPFFKQAYDQGARIHNNSWGDNEDAYVQNNYTTGSQDVDEFMWSHKDFLIVFAAGNSGPRTGSVGSPATSKSGLSIGATARGANADKMAGFSSCGPTDDGRLKPELTVPGAGIVSASDDFDVTTNNCGRESMSGTSMAAPGAAGLAALVRQYYTDGFYPSGTATPEAAFAPSAALLRATLLNSGRSMTGTPAFPANCQGWGRITLDDALFFPGDARQLSVHDDTVGFARGASGETRRFKYNVRAGQPLKVTLAWTDFPSTPASAAHLVNDLDLDVIGPDGTTWHGSVFASGVSATGGSADRKNTSEQVLLASPKAGEYTIVVRAFTVPNGPQPFAVVVTADMGPVVNQPPTADAGTNQSAIVGALIALDGSKSSDDGMPSPLTYSWKQVAGPPVALDATGQAVVHFTPRAPGSYCFELTVTDGAASAIDEVTVAVTGAEASVVFEDNFESNRGWTVNPDGSDTATKGIWERGNPSSTSRQLGKTASGLNDLVTGRLAGSVAGAYDLDGGASTIESPAISLPNGHTTLSFSYYLAHADTATTTDYFRVVVVSSSARSVVFEKKGAATSVMPVWTRTTVALDEFAGQNIHLIVEAADRGKASLLEAAIDDLLVLQLN